MKFRCFNSGKPGNGVGQLFCGQSREPSGLEALTFMATSASRWDRLRPVDTLVRWKRNKTLDVVSTPQNGRPRRLWRVRAFRCSCTVHRLTVLLSWSFMCPSSVRCGTPYVDIHRHTSQAVPKISPIASLRFLFVSSPPYSRAGLDLATSFKLWHHSRRTLEKNKKKEGKQRAFTKVAS